MDRPRRPDGERAALAQRHQLKGLNHRLAKLQSHASGLAGDTHQQQSSLTDLDRRMADLFAAAGLARPDPASLAASDILPSLQLTAEERDSLALRLPDLPSDTPIPNSATDWDVYMADIDAYIAEHGIDLERDPLEQMLPPHVAAKVKSRFAEWGTEFSGQHDLQTFDYMVAGVAGILAGMIDIVLVQVPKHSGFLGAPASEGGVLSNLMKDLSLKILPPEAIDALEQSFKVSYDASTNRTLGTPVPGLGPRSHRLQSLGHDPVLGWIFGVWDILTGRFSAIGKDGSIIVQAVDGFDPAKIGIGIFSDIIDAFRSVAGHMASDIATPAGLPPPFFGLLQFCQFGDLWGGRTVADIARLMYRQGYDFRHFLAGGVCTALIEAIVRIAWTVREVNEGKDIMDALPVGNKPRLRSGLLLAHTVAAAVNAGKVAVTQNPLSVNWAQWLAFFRYLLPQAEWLLAGRERERRAFLDGRLEEGWRDLQEDFSRDLRLSGIKPLRV